MARGDPPTRFDLGKGRFDVAKLVRGVFREAPLASHEVTGVRCKEPAQFGY